MVTVVDYGAGNLPSVVRALHHLGAEYRVSADPTQIAAAERVIVPGVGEARDAMTTMKECGIDEAVREASSRGAALLGICLGSQIVLDHSEESDTPCLGLIPGRARAFDTSMGLKVPHMGWNTVHIARKHPVTKGLSGRSFYFVHSYHPVPISQDAVLATCEYGIRFASVIGVDNVVAAQFHPEKSGIAGLALMQNYLAWRP